MLRISGGIADAVIVKGRRGRREGINTSRQKTAAK